MAQAVQSQAKQSKARNQLALRLKDIEQLISAHEAITQFKKASAAAQQSRDLSSIKNIIDKLITSPKQGRRGDVDAINRAAYVLLLAHFQGFIEDLYRETGTIVLTDKVQNIDTVLNTLGLGARNPYANTIEEIFNAIGIYDVMSNISWQKRTNAGVRQALTNALSTRNQIAHGKINDQSKSVNLKTVKNLLEFIRILSDNLDSEVRIKFHENYGEYPW